MTKFYNEILCKLETAIQDLEIETDYSIQRIETVIDLIIKSLLELKQFVLAKGFKNTDITGCPIITGTKYKIKERVYK